MSLTPHISCYEMTTILYGLRSRSMIFLEHVQKEYTVPGVCSCWSTSGAP